MMWFFGAVFLFKYVCNKMFIKSVVIEKHNNDAHLLVQDLSINAFFLI